MKLSVLKPFALLCAGMLMLSACHKDDDDELIPAYYNTIQGEWTLAYVGADLNGDNIINAGEVYPVTDSSIVGTLKFNADRSGYAYINYDMFPLPGTSFTYAFENNGGTLITTFRENDKKSSTVNTLDAHNLILQNKSTGIANGIWLGFAR